MLQAIPSVTTALGRVYACKSQRKKKNLLIITANANVATVKAMSTFSL